jgi:excisionase family DNA binding protein
MNLKIDLNPPSDKIPAEAAARLLNCSAQTLRRMMQRGELRAYHVGRRTFYLCEEIENLFKPFPTHNPQAKPASEGESHVSNQD